MASPYGCVGIDLTRTPSPTVSRPRRAPKTRSWLGNTDPRGRDAHQHKQCLRVSSMEHWPRRSLCRQAIDKRSATDKIEGIVRTKIWVTRRNFAGKVRLWRI